MKKLLAKGLVLTTMVGCLAGFAGCHGAKETLAFEMPEEFDTTKQHEITFWAKNDTNRTQVDIYEKAIRDFEALYPNVKVNIRLYTDYGRIYNDVITNIATNTTPNVCITYPDHIATYLTGENQVVPMDALFFDKEYGLGGTEVKFDAPTREEIIPKFLEECAFNGHYYAVPYMRSSEVCYINKTFVERLGYTLPEKLTWDFLWEVSEAAMELERDDTFRVNRQKVMVPFIYKSTDNMMITMLKQKGAGYSTDAGEIQIFNDTTKELLYTIAEHGKTRAFSTFKISSYPANFLNAGQCIFAIDSTAGATWMGTDAPLCDIAEEKIVKFETVVMPLPQFDNENPQMISQGPSMCIFNKEDPQEVLASWLFVQFMLTNEVQIAYAQTEGYVPVTSKAQESAEYQDYLSRSGEDNELYYSVKLDATKLLLENIDNTFVTPVFNGSASLRDAAGQMIEETVKGVRRKKVVDEEFLAKLFDDMTSLYRLDQLEVQGGGGQGEKVLGELPKGSKMLLGVLAGAWVLILLYGAFQLVKSKRNEN
ncbi:MAG: extracellular solute-binding protein [Lachnospiraceae bacterium]|nr:extracellular solute-binding protein [Lachnospiraceae bacterium]